jgi:hypothetical protein
MKAELIFSNQLDFLRPFSCRKSDAALFYAKNALNKTNVKATCLF